MDRLRLLANFIDLLLQMRHLRGRLFLDTSDLLSEELAVGLNVRIDPIDVVLEFFAADVHRVADVSLTILQFAESGVDVGIVAVRRSSLANLAGRGTRLVAQD